MYLSKLLLDPQNRQVQKEIANHYELHRTLTAQFPQEYRQDIGLLYRIELPQGQEFQPATLLIQTQIAPDWKTLEDKGLLLKPPQVKEFLPQFPKGASFFFRLLANPTIRRKQANGGSKRVGLYTLEEQQRWINRKAEQGGFQIQAIKMTDLGMVESRKQKHNRTYHIKHFAVQFDGILLVNHTDQFEESLKNGIGSAKSFGFGLLSLAK